MGDTCSCRRATPQAVPCRAMELASLTPVKPRLRGVSHQYAFFVSLLCGVGLILAASDGRARLAAASTRRRSRACWARARCITA